MDLSSVDPVLSDEEYEDLHVAQEDEDGCTLEDGVDMRDLLSGCVFQLRMSEDAAKQELDQEYNSKEVFEQVELQCIGDEEDVFIPDGTPFEKISEKMFNLTPDGKVKKRVLQEGYGEVVPPNALVWFHHNSYYEMCESPFDSSYLRGVPIMRRLGVNQCVPGLEIGLQSMKVGEKAWFLVHYDFAYKKLGVPPRIPPESDILFQVEMKKYLDNDSAMKIGEAEEDEVKKMEFAQVYHAASALVEDANLVVKQKKYEPAAKLYRKALRCLERATKSCDEEEQKFIKMEVKINTNLAVILNKLGEHQKAISAARNALYYKPGNAKAYYHLSMAHLHLGSHDKAKEAALTAKRYEPRSADVLALLTKIEKNQQLYEQNSVMFAKNIFGSSDNKGNRSEDAVKGNKNKDEEVPELKSLPSEGENNSLEKSKSGKATEAGMSPGDIVNCSEKFKLTVIDYVKEFVDDAEAMEAPLATNLSYDEEKFVRQQARNYKLMIQVKEANGGRCLFLTKK